MPQSSLRVFCTPTDAWEWIRLLASEKGLGALVFASFPTSDSGTWLDPDSVLKLSSCHPFSSCYLIDDPTDGEKALSKSKIMPKLSGWIAFTASGFRVRGGDALKGALNLSELSAYTASNGSNVGVNALRWLKSNLKRTNKIRYGVSAQIVGMDQSHLYKDIAYTQSAAKEHFQGTSWGQVGTRVRYWPKSGSDYAS